MHQKRQEVTTKIPIPRKGTKYVVRASSHLKEAVPVVVAVRDILKLARTSKEVKRMINNNLLKINGKLVKDLRESIKLFNLFEADKLYHLALSNTHRFVFKEHKQKNERLCKIIGQKLLKGSKIQINLHDGTNIISGKKFKVGDSLYLDLSGKITKHVSVEKGKNAFVMSGKYAGLNGKIESTKDKKAVIKFTDKEGSAELSISQIIVE